MEHKRTENKNNGTVYQWVDGERYAVIDSVTGELIRFAGPHAVFGTYEDAMKYTEKIDSVRCVIVKMECIIPHIVSNRTNNQ